MQKLAENIAWHERQILLLREALSAADVPSNASRSFEVPPLSATLARLELTLQQLLELQKRRD